MKQVEKRIYEIEGFNVRILHGRDGRDVRSDKANVKQYSFKRALKHSKSVAAWSATSSFVPAKAKRVSTSSETRAAAASKS